ncbi:MAG: hypothetical protein ACLFS9_11840, partial [Nitriliruptoraceae bacterium]
DHRRDQARLRAVRGVPAETLPPGISLGLPALETPRSATGTPSAPGRLVEVPAAPPVTDLDCESETSRVDDWRITVTKVLKAAGWEPGTVLDAHIDLTEGRVWLRTPATEATPCDCGCGHTPEADGPAPIPGVEAVLEAAVIVQSRGRVKLPANLLRLLCADRDGARITATTVTDLDAVLLIGAADVLRRLLPDLTGAPTAGHQPTAVETPPRALTPVPSTA